MAVPTVTAVAVVVATNTSSPSLGPSLWFLIMIIASIPTLMWITYPSRLTSSQRMRNGILAYAALGVVVFGIIVNTIPSSHVPTQSQISDSYHDSEECQQIIDRYIASTDRSQEAVNQYLNCHPSARVGWVLWMFVGIVVAVVLAGVVHDNLSIKENELNITRRR